MPNLLPQRRGALTYSGNNQPPNGIRSHLLGNAGSLVPMAMRYFGIDLNRLPQMSDQELAQYADRAKEMKRLTEVLPILEEHFATLIEGQIAYEEFQARVLQQATAAGKKIDGKLVNIYLANRGYQMHTQQLTQRLTLGSQKQDAEHRNATQLAQMDFTNFLQIAAMRYQMKATEIGNKLPMAQRQMELDKAARQEAQDRRELLTYGGQGRYGNGVGWFRRLFGG